MQRRLVWFVLFAAACAVVVPARSGAVASPIILCNLGTIVKLGDPSLSAPSPAYPGSKITSSAGSWSSCGESFTGFYAEWLRDGNVISGPTWVAGLPGTFGYVVQTADVGHRLTSALRPCNAEGCYGSYAGSSNAVVPVAAPPPPPPPPPPVEQAPVVASGHVREASGTGVYGATIQLYRDVDTDSTANQIPLATTTTDPNGYYVLRAANDGAVAAEISANDGWVNFAIEGTAGDSPYYDVVARRWDPGRARWLSGDEVEADDSSTTVSSPTTGDPLADDLSVPLGASVNAGDWPNVSGPCRYASVERTTLVSTEVDPTIIGELHVARDAHGTFYYGQGSRADTHISVGVSVGGWHLGGYKHVTTMSGASISVTNSTSDWARAITSSFLYGKYKHERTTLDPVTGQPLSCGTAFTLEPKLWLGNYQLGADLSAYLHQCQTKFFLGHAVSYGPNGTFSRSSRKLQTWEGAARVNLGSGGLSVRAWSGASAHVGYRYSFGSLYQDHWLCGNDSWPAYASRIFAGG
jgi:hypothetical protein